MTNTPGPAVQGQRPRVDGKFLAVGGRRFLVKGVTYGTFAPGSDGAQFPEPAQIAKDFELMAAAGLNTVRTYTVPTLPLLEAAAQHGLRVMVGLPWAQHVAFLDDLPHVRQIRKEAVATVRTLASHPATLMFAVGNEIPPAIVRWHGQRRVERFLRELYEEIKAAAPESLLTYVNFPSTEYLDVDCFDLCAFNVYLHREADLRAYLARLQHIAGSKPLLLAEAGTDSVREGLEGQARITAMQLRAAFAEGACGAVAFSWTDEWWRGGYAVDDWAFGLVDRDRRAKPALAAVAKAFADAPFAADERARWPKVSVVVCAHNAGETIDDCLTSLAALTYPHVELIVINDGSRDATGTIARGHSGVRVIDVPNGGLSSARNIGLGQATGEIVAYTDADVRVDPEWLTYLVQPLLARNVAGVGGPNVVPQDDPWVAQCVARAPGGPTHVLLDDRVAEHIPGCNMAFRRDALLAIGGFNPAYLRAGDDVDICWRLQASGQRVEFAPSALVWHHHRRSVAAFWRQQVGYGESEAWLAAHHPEKFAGGGMLWRGRIYSPLPFLRSFARSRVNTGVWGTAAFPSVYTTTAHPLQLLPHSLAWMTAATALLAAGVLGLATSSNGAWLLFVLGASGWATTVVRCLVFAHRSDLRDVPAVGRRSAAVSRILYRMLIAWLHLVQPIARVKGRIHGMWALPPTVASVQITQGPWKSSFPVLRDAGRSALLLMGGTFERSFWSESWTTHSTLLNELVGVLRASRPAQVVDLDDGWRADRDLSVAVGRWGWLHAQVLVEEHARGCCLFRAGTRLRPSVFGAVQMVALVVLLVAGTSAALTLDWPSVNLVSVMVAVTIIARATWQATRATAVFDRALGRVAAAAGMLALPVEPATPAQRPFRPRFTVATGAVQGALITLLVASAVLGSLSVARDAMAMRPSATPASVTLVDQSLAASGGVAVGIAGDLFVADAQEGVIRRLRPRPPLDASWTASDIGTDVYPLLGTAVSFDAAADIALASNGDLYVADARNTRICRITPSTGTIETIIDSGSVLRGPGGVAVARNGDVYVADTLNNRIRMIVRATGLISTIAGDGRIGNSGEVGDGGPALLAHLNRPTGLAIDPDGDLYVADTGHNRVRKISAMGVISTVAGDGTEGAQGDGGPATSARLAAPMGLALVQRKDQAIVLYVADSLNNRVRAIAADGSITTLDGAGRVVSPVRIAYHPAGWLYIKDASPDGVTAVAIP